jgi:putative membrane protein insertion efficiency factor
VTPQARVLSGAVRAYQLTLAPLLGGQCRFTPSCSAYAMEALATHGAARGARLAAWRVLRCSPLCAGGHDPVPPVANPARSGRATKICVAANPEAV